jgi:hypothetical protein
MSGPSDLSGSELLRPEVVDAYRQLPRGRRGLAVDDRPLRPRLWPALTALLLLAFAAVGSLLIRVPVLASGVLQVVADDTVTIVTPRLSPGVGNGRRVRVILSGSQVSGIVTSVAAYDLPELRTGSPLSLSGDTAPAKPSVVQIRLARALRTPPLSQEVKARVAVGTEPLLCGLLK